MKKILSLLLVIVLCFGMAVTAAEEESLITMEKMDKKQKQLNILEKIQNETEKNNQELKVEWSKDKEVPSFITGRLSEKQVKSSMDAVEFLLSHKDLFKLAQAEYGIKKMDVDDLGTTHFRTNQLSDGIPVFGGELIVHTDINGIVTAINGNVEVDIPDVKWSKTINLDKKQSIDAAEASLEFAIDNSNYISEPQSELYIYKHNDVWQPVYIVNLKFMTPYAANLYIYVNAQSGEIVKSQNSIMDTAATGTGVGVFGNTRTLNLDYVSGKYYMRDVTKGALIETYNANKTSSIPGTIVSDTDNNFNAASQAPAVDAHANTEIVYNYYKNNFNRNSFDNNGATMRSTVNFREISSQPYNNAFWNGSQMVYGDGDGVNLGPVGSALDVVAHEFTHAVTDHTADLVYEYQPGALNESFSDVFGYLIEGETRDWLLGEDCYTPNTPGDAFRSLQDPTLYDQPAHMNNYQNLPNTQAGDWGGVHINSGIPNKAFYLAATSINNNTYMAKIYYRALTTYLSSYSQFTDARNALVQSATDLYGSAVAQKIADAFTAVGIGSSTTPGGDTYESNNTMSAAYGPLASGTTYNSYIYSSTDVDYYYFNTTRTGTISVTLGNLAGDYDLYLYNSAGTLVAKSEYGSTTSESISYSASSYGKFYVRVVGYNGAYSTSKAYALKVVTP